MLITWIVCAIVINFSAAISEFLDSDDIYSSKNSNDYVPCDRGWYYFRDKCYKVGSRTGAERYTWSGALELCKGYGADLVSIQSQAEQDFIVAYLQLDAKWWAWIGLTDRDKEGDWKWNDGSVFNYSNWHVNEPSGQGAQTGKDEEDCVHIIFDITFAVDAVGKWNDRSCDATEYALCEKNPNPKKKSPNLMYCSPQDGGGWKYENSCYHIVMGKKSWEDAEYYCKTNHKGHLLTIRDTLEDLFLELALPDIGSEVWIGIKIQDELQQKWSSGWHVSYERFQKDERYAEGTCVARKSRKEWITVPCSRKLRFICEAFEATPPALTPPPVGSYCPTELDDWRDLGGDYCYYIQTGKSFNFYEANFECQRRGGDLVSIHSQEEADVLLPFVRYTGHSIFIGLIRYKENNEEFFGWTDKSEFDYTKWSHGEPNRLDEKCVEAGTRTLEWWDMSCDKKVSGFICSIRKIIPPPDDTENCASFCIEPHSYLFGVINQCPEAKRISLKKK